MDIGCTVVGQIGKVVELNTVLEKYLKFAGIDGNEDAIVPAGALEIEWEIIEGLKKRFVMGTVVVDFLQADNIGFGVAKNLGDLTKASTPESNVWILETFGKGSVKVAVGEAVPRDN